MTANIRKTKTTLALLVGAAVLTFGVAASAAEKAPRVETAFERDTSNNAQTVSGWDGLHPVRSVALRTTEQAMRAGDGASLVVAGGRMHDGR